MLTHPDTQHHTDRCFISLPFEWSASTAVPLLLGDGLQVPHVEQPASVIYERPRAGEDGGGGQRPRLITTEYAATHSMQANTKLKQVGIAADWWLLSLADELLSPGTIQSTFSGSAWHMSLRGDQLKHVDYRTKCVFGGGPPFNLFGMPDFPHRGKGYYREDDSDLEAVRAGAKEIDVKLHHEL